MTKKEMETTPIFIQINKRGKVIKEGGWSAWLMFFRLPFAAIVLLFKIFSRIANSIINLGNIPAVKEPDTMLEGYKLEGKDFVPVKEVPENVALYISTSKE